MLINKKFILILLAVAPLLPANWAHAQQDLNLVTAIEQVAEKVGPAVVSIKTETTARISNATGNPYSEDLFREFFEEFFGAYPDGEYQGYERKYSGLGSGVIIDKEGYILTNEHVIGNADKIMVTLSDRRSFPAQLKGVDPRSDLALIKIDAPDLPVATLGNSDNIKIGQWVVAIGNPFGQILDDPEPTVTQGVVSALHRVLPATSRHDTDYSDLIQTDAAINPGNSGGPLVNLQGEIVGINVAIFSTSGGYQGIGFAVPANYARDIVTQIIKGQSLEYGWIGVGIQDLNERLIQYFNLKSHDGVLVNRVVENSPAQKSGLKDGDIILVANDIRVRSTTALIRLISRTEIGKPMTLLCLRDNKEFKVSVTVERRPSLSLIQNAPESNDPALFLKRWRGMEIRDIPQDLGPAAQTSPKQGIMVQDVLKNSPADNAGIQMGDIIVAVNKQPVNNVKDFHRIVSGSSADCLIRTLRGHFVIQDETRGDPRLRIP